MKKFFTIAITLTALTFIAVGFSDPTEIKKDAIELAVIQSTTIHVDASAKAAFIYDMVAPAPLVLEDVDFGYQEFAEAKISVPETKASLIRDRSPPKIRTL